jgi:hypothetical protein
MKVTDMRQGCEYVPEDEMLCYLDAGQMVVPNNPPHFHADVLRRVGLDEFFAMLADGRLPNFGVDDEQTE